MNESSFAYDVYLGHSARDRERVRPIAELLRRDGLAVFVDAADEPAAAEAGLEASRALLLCYSAHGAGAEWRRLEAASLRFRDPLDRERRFLLLRLDSSPLPPALEDHLHFDWQAAELRDTRKLVDACRPPPQPAPREAAPERTVSLGHTETLRALAFSPDGRQLLSGSDDKTLRLWDLASGICLRVFEGHDNTVSSVAFSPDGRQALSGSYGRIALLWDLASGRQLQRFPALNRIWCVAFSADGERVYTGSSDNVLRIWDKASGTCLQVLKGHQARVLAIAASPDGQRLLSASHDKTLRLWDASSGQCLQVLRGHTEGVGAAAFLPGGREALSGAADATVRWWDLATGDSAILAGGVGPVQSLAVTADGRYVLIGSTPPLPTCWELAPGRPPRIAAIALGGPTQRAQGGAVQAVAVSRDGRQAASASGETLRWWELPAGRALGELAGHGYNIAAVAFDRRGKRAVSASSDQQLRLWDLATGRCLQVLAGHGAEVRGVAISPGERHALSASLDKTVRLWSLDSGSCQQIFTGHGDAVHCVAFAGDGQLAASGSADRTVRLWRLKKAQNEGAREPRVLRGHTDRVTSVAFSPDGRRLLSAAADKILRLWDLADGSCLFEIEGHYAGIEAVAFDPDGSRFLTASADNTLALWHAESGRCLRVFEGHGSRVSSVAFSPDGRRCVSGSADTTVRVWDPASGRCEAVFTSHADGVVSVAFGADGEQILSATANGVLRLRQLPAALPAEPRRGDATPAETTLAAATAQVAYTNAKVLLVGESGAGKTGLSQRLVHDRWQPTESTVGAWATQWSLAPSLAPEAAGNGQEPEEEREIWLWDFGGQADQRLIHQLYMEDAAVAVLVFDGQKPELFESLGQWDRDLSRASRRPFRKLLALGRADAGGLRASRGQLEAFAAERGYGPPVETSAKLGRGCAELKAAILAAIDWRQIPWRSSPRVFKRLKDEILRLKDEGRVLMRWNELRDALRLRLAGEATAFSDGELKAVLGLLSGPGVLWELSFGGWVLLQPERINAYAQAVIATLREDPLERGCLPEADVLAGALTYHSSQERLPPDEERFVLLAMHQTLVERDLCLRENTERGALLIFPSFYRRERPELAGHPAVLLSYKVTGFLDDLYATLVVRLHHTGSFRQDQLWRHAADFRTLTGKKLGLKLLRQGEGAGELEIYFEPGIPLEEKIIFARYVHEHLQQKAAEMTRLRHYVCPRCHTPVGGREIAMRRLESWLGRGRPAGESPGILCQECEQRMPLWDELEQCFASPELQQQVRELQEAARLELDNESRERVLVGEVISTVALAGQISRELTVSDHGIDMEIEWKDDQGRATARRIYLQLKSGDSYLRERRGDGAEIFRIPKPRHADYWLHHPAPVFLVIRESGGEVRWMEIRDYLRRESEGGTKPVTQIVFEGERLDVRSVRRWRDRLLAAP